MISEALFGLLMLSGMFLLGLSFWALGQFLRSRGYGPQLDAIDRQFTPLRFSVDRARLSAGLRLFSTLQAYKQLPLIGSKADLVLIERVRVALVNQQQEMNAQQQNNRL